MWKKGYDKLDENVFNRIKVGDNDGGIMDVEIYSDEEGKSISISSTSENNAGEESESDNDGGH